MIRDDVDLAKWYKFSLVSVNNEGVNMIREGRFGHAVETFHSATRMLQSCKKDHPHIFTAQGGRQERSCSCHHDHEGKVVTTSSSVKKEENNNGDHKASTPFDPMVICVTIDCQQEDSFFRKKHDDSCGPHDPSSPPCSPSTPTNNGTYNAATARPSWWSNPQQLEEQFYRLEEQQDGDGSDKNLAVQILQLPMLVVDENRDGNGDDDQEQETEQQQQYRLPGIDKQRAGNIGTVWPSEAKTTSHHHRRPGHDDDNGRSTSRGGDDDGRRPCDSHHDHSECCPATTTKTHLDFVLFYNLALSYQLLAAKLHQQPNCSSPMIRDNHVPFSLASTSTTGTSCGPTYTSQHQLLLLHRAAEFYTQGYEVLATQDEQDGEASIIPLTMVILNNVGQIYLELDNAQEATHCFHWLLCIMAILHQSGNSSQLEHWNTFRVNVWCGILSAWNLRFKSYKPAPAA